MTHESTDSSEPIEPPIPETPKSANTNRRFLRRRYIVSLSVIALVLVGGIAFAVIDAKREHDKKVSEARIKVQQATKAVEEGESLVEEAEIAQAEAASCADALDGFKSALEDMNGRLAVGLNIGDYSDRLGDIAVEYSDVDFGEMNLECLNAAVKGEKAYNAYVRAKNVWNDCLFGSDFTCSNDDVLPELRAEWAKATRSIDALDRRLQKVTEIPDLQVVTANEILEERNSELEAAMATLNELTK